MRLRLGGMAFALAGMTLVACWVLFLLVPPPAPSRPLFIAGNVLVAVGLVMLVLAMSALGHQGETRVEGDFTSTTRLVKSGIYALVRHPLYLGWLLMYPAAMLAGQSWFVSVLGVVGMLSMVAITREADDRLVDKFGSAYREYMQEVPGLNIILGFWRTLRR
jgi:protein-S-isoprenylcysteine O-methyltransferase Ste14